MSVTNPVSNTVSYRAAKCLGTFRAPTVARDKQPPSSHAGKKQRRPGNVGDATRAKVQESIKKESWVNGSIVSHSSGHDDYKVVMEGCGGGSTEVTDDNT